MTKTFSLPMRAALCLALAFMSGQAAVAGPTDIANVPLGTNTGTLPNLLFDLDDSGSMNWDFMPDYVSPNTGGTALTQSRPCMVDANKTGNAGAFCNPGDPPYAAGGPHGFNGVGYDPNFRYKPGVSTSGQPLLNPPSGLPLGAGPSTTIVVNDTFAKVSGQTTTNVDLATNIPDVSYCNSNNVCRRPGADTSGRVLPGPSTVSTGTIFDSANSAGITVNSSGTQTGVFPYRTNPSNASNASTIFGLPEMMSIGALARPAGGSTTVTVTTVEAHGLTTSDRVFVTSGTANMNVTCAAVATAGTNTFTYDSGNSGSSSINGSYRKCLAGTWTRSSSTVTVSTSPNAPNLTVGDVITVVPSSSFSTGAFTVTSVGGTSFQYTSSTGTGTITGFWVRTGLYNRGSQPSGPAVAYAIVPVEYCSDVNLTNCVFVAPGSAAPAGFTQPAYVRFCQTQGQALAHGGIGDASGTPRCRSKYNETSGIPQYTFARYGWFQRDTIVSSVSTYGNRQNRADCAAATSCTYAEELNNYATWYTYYRTRLQMMKASVGIAFVPFIGSPSATPPKPNSIRMGFITMHAQDSGTISTTGNKYLRIQDFDTTQATNFYNKFYANTAGNSTPLQEALARAGWIFAGKLNTGLTSGIPTSDDPITAACQRNYTLLTTDGFWNNLSSNLPLTPAGKTIGNLDSSPSTLLGNTLVDRPLTTTLDGTGSSSTTFTPSGTTSEQAVCQGSNTANFPTIGGPTTCGCTAKQHAVIQQNLTSGTTTTFVNGIQTGSTPTTNQVYTNVTGCVAGNWVEQDTPQTVTEDQVCRRSGGSNAVFSDGTTVSCSSCSSNRFVLIRQTKTQTQTLITTDGVQTQNGATVTGSTITYSTNGSTFSATAPSGGSCANSAPTSPLSPNPQTVSGATVTTSAPGTPVAAWTPNPQTVAGGTPTTTFSAGGTASTVADTALYFYQTKLRGGTDLNGDNTGPKFGPNTTPPNTLDLSTNSLPVKAGAKDFIPYQHMVTFGIGLADGLMRFQPDYASASSGDYFNINNGTSGACFWTPGACNWPAPADNTSANLDDLWHAAVNGRGNYFQALNADALSTGISTVLASVNAQVAAASASATSSPNVTPTDNQIFSTTYETNTWSGSVFAQKLDPVTGAVLPAIQWIADPLILAKAVAGTRNLLTFDPLSSTTKIKPFAWTSFTSLQEQNFFQNKCSPSALSQCGGLSLTDQGTANTGANMVAFLSGDQTLEGSIYRDRIVIDPVTGAITQTVLGDTVNAKPLFVREPSQNYVDTVTPSYASFASANATRAPRVYVGANDGFLHAFDGDTGDESWAYAPRFLLPNLYVLADKTYSNNLHRFYVDGSPEAFDVFDTTATPNKWRTILIGGAGAGGRGWYALDITNPSSPTALWEFCQDSTLCAISDADLGLAYGNPIVGKRSVDGRWVVVLSSGLNNISPGSGVGFFYVLDAITGAVLNKVSTGQGNSLSPSGLMKMSAAYPSVATDATMRFIYGGDQNGNIWRLDLGVQGTAACDPPAAGTAPCVSHLVQLNDGTTPLRFQPITTKPPLTIINNFRVVFVGTGRYLGDGAHGGVSDLTDPGSTSGIAWLQSLYAIKDRNVDYGTAFRSGAVVQQTLSLSGISNRTVTKNAVDWSVKDGWFLDFVTFAADPSAAQGGERVNLDPKLVLGTLAVVTNTPDPGGICSAGGSSRLYGFDYLTGGYIGNASTATGLFLANELAVGFSVVMTQSGLKGEVRLKSGGDITPNIPQNSGGSTLKRFSYRER